MSHPPVTPLRRRRHMRTVLLVTISAATAAVVSLTAGPLQANASVERGTDQPDVLIGADNDNAANVGVQPAGVVAKQHLDNADLLVGHGGNDLLIGRTGSDSLDGSSGDDILIGGLEGGTAPIPSSDIIRGSDGDDINIWAPGDGSDLFDGGAGRDSMVLGPIVNEAREVTLTRFRGRDVPRVTIDSRPQFSCTIERSPATDGLNVDALVRFFNNGTLAATMRVVNVEQVLCPSPNAGMVNIARLGARHDAFVEVPITQVNGDLGAILGNVSGF
jgi:hypothetical protein